MATVFAYAWLTILGTPISVYVSCHYQHRYLELQINSLHATGTFMYPRIAPALRDGHIYVPSDLIRNIGCAVTTLG